jgi:branched-subunit amino acid ABC-type transport system permease component
MKKHIREFMRRGFVACGIGPLVLAVLYWILQKTAGVETLTVNQVCLGILSLSVLAFVAGGLNFVYQIERLPLMGAIFIHGAVLYASYLVTYLVNGWLEQGVIPILVFSAIFILGFLAIWAVIYAVMRSRTQRINELLKMKQQIKRNSFEN